MFFGEISIDQALGGVAVHSIRKGGLVLKKGTHIGPAEVEALRRERVESIVIARLDPGDVGEDIAAERIAARLGGEGVRVAEPFTGRANLFAEQAGVLVIDRDGVDRVNAIDESITFATLPAFDPVKAGEMIATVKIIPFAVEAPTFERALAGLGAPIIRIAPFRPLKVAAISTVLPGLKESVIARTLQVLKERLAPAAAKLVLDERVPHQARELALALDRAKSAQADLTIIFGASAIADRRDVIPAAIEISGGAVEHFGMPVDPGNLLLLGRSGAMSVLGAPGCARSPKENGFDWILHRLLAGLPVTRADIVGLGVGGLLMEIVSRPQPRAAAAKTGESPPCVAAIVLAAGRSTRMEGANKLLEDYAGKPLVRHAVEAALASKASSVTVVTGHQQAEVRAALAGLAVSFVHNPNFAEGLSTSVRAGIAALPAESDAALIALGDMPLVDAALLDRLISAFEPDKGALIVLPVTERQRGNPVIWARRFFDELQAIEGDAGGRQILKANSDAVVEIPVSSSATSFDVDTKEALAQLRQLPT
ncbi:molybdopterin-binding/glycosyltransferase family 2 protein [Labrys sp. ZIDIC5]|uniref:molybdopterin-binding/glycosyltransferase family 2 protein n=1 Tax=Labrys sedimenti TaxID=3106036 RepID=UPI002ACAD8FE|nr:molybdopterin-binding/glycosyltransferase family 2 protein [Labrys sp. ZIDIC5]MDZ5448209.1 molybdopterin-binding/glycosyltransferase family 2 protein [Labrys sp. ZIDIC5]